MSIQTFVNNLVPRTVLICNRTILFLWASEGVLLSIIAIGRWYAFDKHRTESVQKSVKKYVIIFLRIS